MRDNGYFFHETPDEVWAAFADTHENSFPASYFAAERLKSVLAVGGCKEDDIARLSQDEHAPLNWSHCVGYPVWLISASLLFAVAVHGRRRAKKLTAGDAEEGRVRMAEG
jgi:hypothetical protein